MFYHLSNEIRERNGKNSKALIIEKTHGILSGFVTHLKEIGILQEFQLLLR